MKTKLFTSCLTDSSRLPVLAIACTSFYKQMQYSTDVWPIALIMNQEDMDA